MGSTERQREGAPPTDVPLTTKRPITPKLTRRGLLAAATTMGMLGHSAGSVADQLIWGTHISLAPTWLDPAETGGVITPFMLLYAIHDALIKPMPNDPEQLCLAQSYAPSEDGLSHEFTLRDNASFHNGEPVTAEDVKFSFQRYRGNAARFLQSKVAAIDIPERGRVIFHLNAPWADFLAYYCGVTGAGWIVPKNTSKM